MDVTYGAIERLSFLPERPANENGVIIAGQKFYDVYFTGGYVSNIVLTDVSINGVNYARTERTITSPGDVTATVDDYIITVNKTVPQITTVFLPLNPSTSKSIIVKDGGGNAGGFNITIDGNGKTIDGQATLVLAASYADAEFVYNGVEWNILNAYKLLSASGVTGPAGSTNNALAVWDGISGSSLKNSGVTVDGSNNLTANNLSGTNTGNQTTAGTTNRISVTNGSTSPVIDISASYVGQNSITTLGTVTTGTWNGSVVSVTYGGTGASTASGARTNLGLVIGTDVQAYNTNLQSIAGLTSAANKLSYFTGSGASALTDLTAYSRTLLDDTDAPSWRSTLLLKSASVADILGTVSQSGGVPTGSIIERGSNANGEYVKFADGTMICTGSPAGAATSTAVGSIFQGESSWLFPQAFIAAPVITAQSPSTARWANARNATAAGSVIRQYSPTTDATIIIPFGIAVGRWF